MSILGKLASAAGDSGRSSRKELIATTKSAWAQELTSLDHEDDDPGTTWNERARDREPKKMSPRMAWRAIQSALPKDAIISSDIGNNCAIGNAYPTFEEGRKYLAPGLFGPCGYGLPSIMGAKIGRRDVPVDQSQGIVLPCQHHDRLCIRRGCLVAAIVTDCHPASCHDAAVHLYMEPVRHGHWQGADECADTSHFQHQHGSVAGDLHRADRPVLNSEHAAGQSAPANAHSMICTCHKNRYCFVIKGGSTP